MTQPEQCMFWQLPNTHYAASHDASILRITCAVPDSTQRMQNFACVDCLYEACQSLRDNNAVDIIITRSTSFEQRVLAALTAVRQGQPLPR